MMPVTGYYIGLMSGTSLDGIDAVIVDLDRQPINLIASISRPIPAELKQSLLALTQPGDNEIERLGIADVQFSRLQAEIIDTLLLQAELHPTQIQAIGSHGQTIRHRPNGATPFSLQIGDPNTLAELTGISVAADFRRRDLAAGGQGAPLVPAFHAECFASISVDRVIVNVGGMANITQLHKDQQQPVIGYDTGPGNILIDSWIECHLQREYDHSGLWARSGTIDTQLLALLLRLDYFAQAPPKTTGREQFNLGWIDQQLATLGRPVAAADVQATLTELTARSIADAILKQQLLSAEVYLCGGGAHNDYLLERLEILLSAFSIRTTQSLGIPADWVEACAFAWLAKRCIAQLPGNMPSVTGARGERILGGIYPGACNP
ncbi:MAG: anhydro-N-acetylmuramic acid kinase [Motiliproteus sp.]|jgi:anhydro-N-acetylmuramic acid kinase